MGYRKVPRIYTLEFDGELTGLVVRIKSIKFGKIRRLIALMDEDGKDVELMNQINAFLVDAIVSWTLQDENGTDVEVSSESIDELDFDEIMEIVNKWLDCMTGPGPELGKGSSSGATFPGQPLTMEAL
jgi:hypothetical protein